MRKLKNKIALAIAIAMAGLSIQHVEGVTYVTDTGGYAYDESRAAVNLAPAIALGTVAIVAIIAIAVQNSHGSSSSHSHCCDSSCCFSDCSSDCSGFSSCHTSCHCH